MPKPFLITEARTRFGCFWLSNRALCLVFGLGQFAIAAISLSQHVRPISHHLTSPVRSIL